MRSYASSFQNFKKLFQSFQKQQQNQYFQLVALSFANILMDLLGLAVLYATALSLLDPQFSEKIQPFLNRFEPAYFVDKPLILWFSGLLVVVFIIKSILSYANSKRQVTLAYRISAAVSDQQFATFLKRGMIHQKSEKSVDRIHQIHSIPNSLAEHLILPSVVFFSELLLLLLALTAVTILQPQLILLLAVSILPVTLILMATNRKRILFYGVKLNEIVPRMYETISNAVHGFADIRLNQRDGYFNNKFKSLRGDYFNYRQKAFLRSSIAPVRIMESVTVLSLFVIALFAFSTNQQSSMAAMLALFASVAFRALPSVNRIIGAFNTFTGMSFILDLLPNKEDRVEDATQIEIKPFVQQCDFKNISIGFEDGVPVLNKLNLSLLKGDFIGIYGESGSGKSTFLNVLLGFYVPQSGEILIDGRPLAPEIRSWQSQLAYVEQDAFMMAGTVLENIAFGDEHPDKELVHQVIKQVSLEDWVSGLAEGTNTLIGEKGSRISGGQRQRLAIARALYSKAEVLVLDEATNALDKTTQNDILLMVKHLNSEGLTIILVSHDQSALKMCNSVYELKNGQLYVERA